ncbi:hypothetical protein F511_26900 [Dorcoceras hygrometricum]|uniref:E3 ubiquitin-protein ligase n=1 Tax=Dorcoceras hygrometricum TaxID=472368 RepID=A0A2Z7B378_9LAMI|nr:hypothetical protein F511_26900 [Dorcoceras hygrometricum]
MLALLIQIVRERRFCGLTTAECLQKELIYKLSIGDATRSQLIKSLPRDLSKIDKIQEVLDTVAVYSHPSGMTQGMYRLHSMYWKELDLYHPHWNSRDLQAAEERYSRFCNVSAMTNQLTRWTKIYYLLRGLAKMGTCRTLAEIVRAVLFYAVHSEKLAASRAPDGVLLTGLHLLALALDVCQVHKESGEPLCSDGDVIPLLAFASEEISISNYGDQRMLSLLVSLMRMHEKENAPNFMEAGKYSLFSLVSSLLNKFAELEPGCMTKLQKLVPDGANQFPNSVLNNSFKETESTSESEKLKAISEERLFLVSDLSQLTYILSIFSDDLSLVDNIIEQKCENESTERLVIDQENNMEDRGRSQGHQVLCGCKRTKYGKVPDTSWLELPQNMIVIFASGIKRVPNVKMKDCPSIIAGINWHMLSNSTTDTPRNCLLVFKY